MISLVHIIFGSIITAKIKKPFFGFILAFASHFILDAIPHFDYTNHLLIPLDALLGFLTIYLIFKRQNKKKLIQILIGGFIAAMPDGFIFAYLFIQKGVFAIPLQTTIMPILKHFFNFHGFFHAWPAQTFFLGIFTQILTLILCAIIIFRNKNFKNN